jgi:hypothetical protein
MIAAISRAAVQSTAKKTAASIANTSDASEMWFGLTLLRRFAAGERILSASLR